MTGNRRLFLRSALCVVSVAATSSSAGLLQAASPEQLVIVVSKNSKMRTISFQDLKRLYMGDRLSGPNGERLLPLNQPNGSSARTDFEHKVLGMDPDEVGRYWIDRKIRGQSGPPRAVSPIDRLKAAIKQVDGTLTYLHSNDVVDGMKVLSIDGKQPSDRGYPLNY